MRTAYQSLASAGIITLTVLGLWFYASVQPRPLTLRFHPYVGEAPLVLNHGTYANPGGEGVFKVRDFQFYISNIKLKGPDSTYSVSESYRLVRFDSEDGIFEIHIPDIKSGDYSEVELGIGVDAAANGTILIEGDLDPNSRMAWNWEVGYKFILIEGGLLLGDTQIPLVYHVGFDENYHMVQLPFEADVLAGSESQLNFKVDMLELFIASGPVDMAALSTVKFDRVDARRIAGGFPRLISLCQADCR